MTPFFMTLMVLAAEPTTGDGTEMGAKPVASAVDEISDEAMGSWFVRLAMDAGQRSRRPTDHRGEALQVLSLLEAALFASPNCAEAYRLTYDVLGRLGRMDAAKEAMRSFVRLRPDHDGACLRLLEMELKDRHTSQDRLDFVRAELASEPASSAYAAALHAQLARYHYERRENSDASRELEHALRLDAAQPDARRLAYDLFGETEPALQRAELALALIRANPTQVNLLWEFGEFLDGLALHTQAQEWYLRAIAVHESEGAGPVSAEHRFRLAASYANSANAAPAKEALDRALAMSPDNHAARLLRSQVHRKLGLNNEADADLDYVAAAHQSRLTIVLKERLALEGAELAWFACKYRPEKDRALELAKMAMAETPPSSLARRAYGYALKMNGRSDEAEQVLAPLAEVDQWAAAVLAEIYQEKGDPSRAMTVLHRAALLDDSGPAREALVAALAENQVPAPAPADHPRIKAALDRFDRRLFDFAGHAEDFLAVTLRFTAEPLPPVGIDVVVRLENVGAAPVTLGDGLMARPLVSLNVTIAGDTNAQAEQSEPAESSREKAFEGCIQVMLSDRRTLRPGEAIEAKVALDTGPVRDHLMRQAATDCDLTVSGMFDPVYKDGRTAVGLTSVPIRSIHARRAGMDTSDAGMAALMRSAEEGGGGERAKAADLLGAILAMVCRPIESTTDGNDAIDPDRLYAALARLLSDSDWRVRCHALDAARHAMLDDRLIMAASPAVRDDNPAVRLLGVRLFAEGQGPRFAKVLSSLSQTDSERMVRLLARSYARRAEATGPVMAANGEE